MSSRPQSSNGQDPSSTGDEVPKKTGRLRSSCDSCHRSKIKCTGSNPCAACLGSQNTCTYSRGSRLGRPKGSKNKRTSSIQENSSTGRVEAPQDTTKVDADVIQWGAVDLTSFDPGLDHGFGSVFADSYVDNTFLFDSNAGVLEPMSPKERLDLHALFTQNPSTFNAPRSLENDSGSGSDTVTTPPNYTTLSQPDKNNSTGFGSTNSVNPTASTASGPLECSCLQQLVKLVYQLEDLRYAHANGPAIDAVLEGVRLADGPWQVLMQCSHCQSKDTYKESFLLFSMSIRILLASIQKLSGCLFEAANTSTITVSIGTFSLPDDAKLEVIDTVVRKALQAIAVALVHLWERTGKPRLNFPVEQDLNNGAPLSPISLFAGASEDRQGPLACYDLVSAFSGTKNTMPLLGTLQFLMKVTEDELRTSTHRKP